MSKQSYLYKLLPVNKNLINNPTEVEKKILEEHVKHLKRLKDLGIVKWYGNTLGKEFELIVFECVGEPEAFNIMHSDPALKQRIMTGQLFPINLIN